ncbi:MAG: hypothetical protein ACJ77N_12085 [Chloroflexota bacterium]|jgi:hypothetical protein
MPGSEPAGAEDGVELHFKDPDAAYRLAAELSQRLDTQVIAGVELVPSEDGPALHLPDAALEDPRVRDLLEHYRVVEPA